MPVKRETQKYVKEELPYRLLSSIYLNSRASLRELGRELNISYHTVRSVLRELEEKYGIHYTLEIDEQKLGFTEGRVITIKFGTKPEMDLLKKLLQDDIFIQDAYLSDGDFDLLLYVVGLAKEEFLVWQWNLRVKFSEYKPIFKFASFNYKVVGFFPLRSELIKESQVLTNKEKEVLILLNNDSRLKLSEMAQKAKIDVNKVLYLIKKFTALGIIKRFTALTQNPDKRIYVGFGISMIPSKQHDKLLISLYEKLINEDKNEVINNWAIISDTNGQWDGFDVCAFQNGEALARFGPELFRKEWENEHPQIERAILTDIIIGKWPFHLENYSSLRAIIKRNKENLLQ